MTAPHNIVGALVDSIISISRSVATFLQRCETFLPEIGPGGISSESLLTHVGNDWRNGEYGLAAAFESLTFLQWPEGDARKLYIRLAEQRLARATLRAWPDQTDPRPGRRPDVLALTCQILANPDAPYTLKIIRFAAVLALRSLYRISNDATSIKALRNAYLGFTRRLDTTQRRRVKKPEARHEPFLLDLMCMGHSIYRAALDRNLEEYYAGFIKYPLGVDPESGKRYFSPSTDDKWPEIHGEPPDFPSLLTLAFSQPVAIPGFDTVTGGLVAAVPKENQSVIPGGLVTLIAGPPGSGKTSLCMSIASRMSELGSQVAYISTEERERWLATKHTAAVDPRHLEAALWPYAQPRGLRADIKFYEADTFDTFEKLSTDLLDKSKTSSPPLAVEPGSIYLPSPYIVIIDSITVLLDRGNGYDLSNSAPDNAHWNADTSRRQLARVLNQFRDSGICVFLVGERRHLTDEKLAYLVDNVFTLDFEEENSRRHPVRIFELQKTRLQTSYRGRHVFHLSRFEGCTISPSLHAVLARSARRKFELPRERRSALRAHSSQLAFQFSDSSKETAPVIITVKNCTHSLVYGWGTTGKARFALKLALEPKHPLKNEVQFDKKSPSTHPELDWLNNPRALVVSFLHDRAYYEDIAYSIMSRRFSVKAPDLEAISVLNLYPGYLDPETLIARIRRHLKAAHIDGRPYTAVVLDGIHNMPLQFPLLTRDPLLLPAIFKALRSEHVDIVSTFTFFRVASSFAAHAASAHQDEHSAISEDSKKLFQQLLTSQCEYSFLVENLSGSEGGRTKISRISAVPGIGKERDEFIWDSEHFRVSWS